jgi:hypothetical protein
MTPTEAKIIAATTAYARGAATAFRGVERKLLVEVVRSIDEVAFAFTMAPNRDELQVGDHNRNLMLVGAASAIEPLIRATEGTPGGVPWGASDPSWVAVADEHLINCGKLAIVGRLAALERYGLAETSYAADGTLVIEVASDAEDAEELDAGWRHYDRKTAPLVSRKARLMRMKDWVARRLDRSVDVIDGWYLRYDGDSVLAAYHREYARLESAGIAEAEALPPTVPIGGRLFNEWTERAVQARASAYQHIAYATRLLNRHSALSLRNLLTCFARREDVFELWASRGESPLGAKRLTASLTLDASSARSAVRRHEIPLPYYIDFGRDFLLLPLFGALLNPYAGQVWHLRENYRRDWDRAVGSREAVFRDELRETVAPLGCRVPQNGFKLRREDGTHATDVDAAIIDPSGRVVLVQLKWPDIYGRSIAERRSRQKNLAAANAWVAAVSEWCSGRTSNQIAAKLGFNASASEPPALLVLARYTARFSGSEDFDTRSGWSSWPRFCEALDAGELDAALRPATRLPVAKRPERHVVRYDLPQGLHVEVRHHV